MKKKEEVIFKEKDFHIQGNQGQILQKWGRKYVGGGWKMI